MLRTGYSTQAQLHAFAFSTTSNLLNRYPEAKPIVEILDESKITQRMEFLTALLDACENSRQNLTKNQGRTWVLIKDIFTILLKQEALTLSIAKVVFDDLRHANLLPCTLDALRVFDPITKANINTIFSFPERYLRLYRWLANIDMTGILFVDLVNKSLAAFSTFSESVLLFSYGKPPVWLTRPLWLFMLTANHEVVVELAKNLDELHMKNLLEKYQQDILFDPEKRHALELKFNKHLTAFNLEEIEQALQLDMSYQVSLTLTCH